MMFYFTLPHFGSNEERLQSVLWLFYYKLTGSRCVLVECISYTLPSGSIVFLFCLPGKPCFSFLFGFKPMNWLWTLYPYFGRNVTSACDFSDKRLTWLGAGVSASLTLSSDSRVRRWQAATCAAHVNMMLASETCVQNNTATHRDTNRFLAPQPHRSGWVSALSSIKTSPVTWFLLCLAANRCSPYKPRHGEPDRSASDKVGISVVPNWVSPFTWWVSSAVPGVSIALIRSGNLSHNNRPCSQVVNSPRNSFGIFCNLGIAEMTSGDDFQHKYAAVCNQTL